MGIAQASFWTSSAALRALTLHIPKLIEKGIINEKGKLALGIRNHRVTNPRRPPQVPKGEGSEEVQSPKATSPKAHKTTQSCHTGTPIIRKPMNVGFGRYVGMGSA
ncbi:hypothetical protein GIB67_034065 [Kingdonia uniflora]|uniref:Uncharacterized protein n=1 Tax=Kingdonia uniflora TaxID=39325 RepID=A0A7J7M672_9MAGN|nr:hypothetical protein GIB67_034065 [Kingdonia uniflora]